MRLINADKFRKDLLELVEHGHSELSKVVELLDEYPTVPSVLCKDCGFYEASNEKEGTCKLVKTWTSADGFCAWASHKQIANTRLCDECERHEECPMREMFPKIKGCKVPDWKVEELAIRRK